jgi:hypothetical protein
MTLISCKRTSNAHREFVFGPTARARASLEIIINCDACCDVSERQKKSTNCRTHLLSTPEREVARRRRVSAERQLINSQLVLFAVRFN